MPMRRLEAVEAIAGEEAQISTSVVQNATTAGFASRRRTFSPLSEALPEALASSYPSRFEPTSVRE